MGWLRWPWHLAALAATAALSVALVTAWQTRRAVQLARTQIQSNSTIAATLRPLDRSPSQDVTAIATPEIFRDAAFFGGHLFVAGPHGLIEYDADGRIISRRRAGIELPPGGLLTLSTAVLAGASTPELVIGTATEGLLSFDGYRLLHARPDDASYRHVTAALPLTSGHLLVGTEKRGLFLYDGRSLTHAHQQIGDVAITALAGVEGDVWIGTVDHGVWHWRAGTIERFGEHEGLPDDRVLSLAVRDERAYVGTAVGVAEFLDGRYVRTLAPGLFAAAIALRGDDLIVATIDGTIAQIGLNTRPSRGVRPAMIDTPAPIERFVTADGRLFALSRDAIFAMDDRTTTLRRIVGADTTTLSDGNVSALSLDRTGRLWVGYFDRGLDILTPEGARLTHVENDHVFCVNRIVHEATGGLTAVATANGLVLFDVSGQPRQVLGRAQGLIADHVTDLVASRGTMTIATPAGLTFFDRDGSRSIYAFQGLVNNHVYALGAAGTEVLAGTLGGASMLDQGAIRASYTTANSALTHNWITAVARVNDGWFVGTYGGGLFRLDAAGEWHRFADLAAIEINPNAMAVTDTHVFAGTLSRGLLVYDRATSRWTTYERGLPSLNVTALAPSDHGLYVGTDNGLVSVASRAFGHP